MIDFKNYKYIVFIHQLAWDSKISEYNLIDGINIYSTYNHPMNELYKKHCLETGLDDGEPFDFSTAIELNKKLSGYLGSDLSDPYNRITIAISILNLYFKSHLGMVRLFFVDPLYKKIRWTISEYGYGLQVDFLMSKDGCYGINDSNINEIKTIFNNLQYFWHGKTGDSPLLKALSHYFYSWNINYLEQTGVGLAIALEHLFSPISNNELSHQIAFNACTFFEKNRVKREQLYTNIKKLYSIRSKVVHGGNVKDWEQTDFIPEMYIIVCKIILKIFLDKNLIDIFENPTKKKEYINDLMFS